MKMAAPNPLPNCVLNIFPNIYNFGGNPPSRAGPDKDSHRCLRHHVVLGILQLDAQNESHQHILALLPDVLHRSYLALPPPALTCPLPQSSTHGHTSVDRSTCTEGSRSEVSRDEVAKVCGGQLVKTVNLTRGDCSADVRRHQQGAKHRRRTPGYTHNSYVSILAGQFKSILRYYTLLDFRHTKK